MTVAEALLWSLLAAGIGMAMTGAYVAIAALFDGRR